MVKKLHYAWIILFVTFFALLAVQGIRLSFGAFIESWENELSLDRGTISLVSTLSFIIYGISQPIAGRLIDRFGARTILLYSTLLVGLSMLFTQWITSAWQLFFLYGVVASIGVGGASNVAATVLVSNWFNEKRGVAFGVLEAGFSVGQMVVVPAALFFIQWYDWKMAVAIFGFFLLVVIFPVLLFLLRNHPAEKNLQPIGGAREEAEPSNRVPNDGAPSVGSIFRSRNFWYLILPFFICGFTTTGLMDTHLIPFAQLCGFTTTVTGLAVGLLAAFNTMGTLMSGFIADRWSSRKFLATLYILRALSICFLIVFVSDPDLLLFFVGHPSLLLLFAISFGLVDFATVAPTQLLATQLFKQYSMGQVMGWLFLSHQAGSALGAYLPGMFYEHTGDYTLAFYVSVLLLVGAAALNLLMPEPDKIMNRKA